MIQNAGTNAQSVFAAAHHPDTALEQMKKFCIGSIAVSNCSTVICISYSVSSLIHIYIFAKHQAEREEESMKCVVGCTLM